MTQDRKRCPHCRQFMPLPLPYGIRLTPAEKRIADIVRRAGDEGISVLDIADMVYANDLDPPAMPARTLWVQIYQINTKIRPKGYEIFNTARGGGPRGAAGCYVLKRIPVLRVA